MPYTYWTTGELEALKRLYDEGLRGNDLAQAVSIEAGTSMRTPGALIKQRIKHYGPEENVSIWTKRQLHDLAELAKTTPSWVVVAEELVSLGHPRRSPISCRLAWDRHILPTGGTRLQKLTVWTPDQDKMARELRGKGLEWEEIAKRMKRAGHPKRNATAVMERVYKLNRLARRKKGGRQ